MYALTVVAVGLQSWVNVVAPSRSDFIYVFICVVTYYRPYDSTFRDLYKTVQIATTSAKIVPYAIVLTHFKASSMFADQFYIIDHCRKL